MNKICDLQIPQFLESTWYTAGIKRIVIEGVPISMDLQGSILFYSKEKLHPS